jgi:transcriptional repressor NrdR
VESVKLTIIKKDDSRESFDRDKLLNGVLKACEKRPIPRDRIERIVGEIEAELRNYEEREIPSSVIGKLVMKRLRDLDKVAYIRFASVYREFTDLGSFERELKKLRKSIESKSGK